MASEHEGDAEVPEGGGSVNFERVRLYLERHPDTFNLADEIDYHDGYVGEDWPRRAYALPRKDIETLLEDCDTYNQETMDANAAANSLREQQQQWLKDKDELERLQALVQSMRHNGALHHFAYSHQKHIEGRGWVNICKICTKDRHHPAHFGSEAKYLDSREVGKQAVEAMKRVAGLLDRLGFSPLLAQNTARELLKGLPGIEPPIEPEEGS